MRRVALVAATLGILLIALWLRPTPQPPDPTQEPDAASEAGPASIVFVMIDTLRADHLGSYGYERPTSPEIDALAERGVLFERVYSVCNWTNPAIKTLFTGLLPFAVTRPAPHAQSIGISLPPELPTLAEILRRAGFRTAGLVDHPGMTPALGFDRGFDRYTRLYEQGAGGRGAWGKSDTPYVLERFAEELTQFGDAPFFLYLHVVYPHRPYRPPDPFRGMFGPDGDETIAPHNRDSLINAYDAEIRRTDELVGRIARELADRPVGRRSYLLIGSDHGEGFWEHGVSEHGHVFHDELLHVPFIVHGPPGALRPTRVSTAVSSLDWFATVLDLAGVAPLPSTESRSLRRFWTDPDARSEPAFSEAAHSLDIAARAVTHEGLRYVLSPGQERAHQLYDLRSDPRERRNLAFSRVWRAAELRRLLLDRAERSHAQLASRSESSVEVDEETRQRLQALGYLQ